MTLTPIAERLTVELSLTVFMSRLGFEHPIFRLRGERPNQLPLLPAVSLYN